MLKELRLKNIVLIEMAEVSFAPGFNVLSGESGSGKSAIMNALNLIAGDRSDASLVRRGAEKGVIEAIFDIDAIDPLISFLEGVGIDHEVGNDLLIRREVLASGKSRAFVNNQAAQLPILRQITDHLFEIVGQHANQKLLSLDYHRQTLDLFGDLKPGVLAFEESWEEEVRTRLELEQLVNSEAQRLRDIEIGRMEVGEIEEAQLKEGEEENLFNEYTQLSNADELAHKASEINRILSSEKGSVLVNLARLKAIFEQLIRLDPSLTEIANSCFNAELELQEVGHTLRNYEHRIEHNPERALELNERLSLISRLKKKYGPSIEDVNSYLTVSREKIIKLENADASIEVLREKHKTLSEKNNVLSKRLTEKRKLIAKDFEAAVLTHLRALNMPKVEFIVELTSQKRSRHGDDRIEFYLIPNVGEHKVSLKECASGGELSRIMLALQALLAGKERIPTLIFDEVDANVGGETATVVGEKLQEIGHKHQVLCITHFPQVAKLAKHHLHIFKQEVEGRTLTSVEKLDDKSRKKELTRMLGGRSEFLS